MISFEEAYGKVMEQTRSWGVEPVPLTGAADRVLAGEVRADRDFPPFDRATKDGIAINFAAVENGVARFGIEGIARAGAPRTRLKDVSNCIEIMTGAVLPEQTDTVVMYEETEMSDDQVRLLTKPERGQNIHRKGSDDKKGDLLLEYPQRITAAEIGVLATVGMHTVEVKKLPDVAIISTGDELVEVHERPLPHQIRKSNVYSLQSALAEEGIAAKALHFSDDREQITRHLSDALAKNDVLIISGGVSRGKFDFLPQVLDELGVRKLFHFVEQKPGKPFWFGVRGESGPVVFSFPGNPVSTFANYHVYFKNWLRKCLGLPLLSQHVILQEKIEVSGNLTRFMIVQTAVEEATVTAAPISQGGSGDLTSLARGDGFIRLEPRSEPYATGETVPFYATRRII